MVMMLAAVAEIKLIVLPPVTGTRTGFKKGAAPLVTAPVGIIAVTPVS
jgi:hypothetical protein